MLVALAVTFFAAAVQGAVGIGFGLLSVPVLTLVDSSLTPVPQLVVGLPLAMIMFVGERHAIEWPAVGRVTLSRIPGIAVGVGLLAAVSQRWLDVLIGVTVLVAVLVIRSGVTIHRNRTSEVVAGAVSGATSTVSSIGGPPLALLYRNDNGPTVRANLAAIYVTGIIMVLIARSVTGYVSSEDLVISAWLLPAMGAGYLLARRVRGRFDGELLKNSILALSAISALGLLVRTFAG